MVKPFLCLLAILFILNIVLIQSSRVWTSNSPFFSNEKSTKDTQRKVSGTKPEVYHAEERALDVKQAFQHVWKNYEQYAFGADELLPITGKAKQDEWGGIGCTLVDALDTLWIMDLKHEFERGRDWMRDRLRFDHLGKNGKSISVFETVIREVGGLLSAYALSKDEVFKMKAVELVETLIPAFDEKYGIFFTYFNPITKVKNMASWNGNRGTIADLGSLQMEMRYLSFITGDSKYAKMGDRFYEIAYQVGSYERTGLYPVHFDYKAQKFSNHSYLTVGALGDSFYEYLLKTWILNGKKDTWLRDMYDQAIQGIRNNLVKTSNGTTYLDELAIPGMKGKNKMDHLMCFVPGMLALGTIDQLDDLKKKNDLELAEKLASTCYQMYKQQPSGLSPDIVQFPEFRPMDSKYRLRPETIESLFYLYRVTKNVIYREWGWEIFQSIQKHCKTQFGYAAVLDVKEKNPELSNKMESFFLAETLKYHYLLQAPDHVLPLDQYVFNTEAHPFRMY